MKQLVSAGRVMHAGAARGTGQRMTAPTWRVVLLACAMAAPAAHAVVDATQSPPVGISQAPLASQTLVPPDIFFLLDDSADMDREYMPDSLDPSVTALSDLRDYKTNPLYYNPDVIYQPPPQSDGTPYTSYADATNAPLDGFKGASRTNVLAYENDFTFGDPRNPADKPEQHAFVYHDAADNKFYVSQDCTHFTDHDCLPLDTLVDIDGDGQLDSLSENIANWFAYYRSRSLVTRSGMMSALDGLTANQQEFRLGWGSVNDAAGDVAPRDYGDVVKGEFWTWLASISNAGSPALRTALQRAGEGIENGDSWDTYTCRSAMTILASGSHWDGGDPLVGNTDGEAGPTQSNDRGQEYTYPALDPYADDHPAADGEPGTLADVAMHYWKTDLSAEENRVSTNAEDPAFWQHMATMAIGIGMTPRDANGAVIDVDALFDWGLGGLPIDPWGDWPDPLDTQDADRATDLLHAGLNGHGGFYSVMDPLDFAGIVGEALERAQARAGTNASLAANSTRVNNETFTYQASYNTDGWSGDLKAFRIDPALKRTKIYPEWSAASLLSNRDAGTDPRTIYFGSVNNQGVIDSKEVLGWSALSTAQQVALGDDSGLVDFLYGTDDGYRDRLSPLGDIVHSQPVFVGRPDPNTYSGTGFGFDGARETNQEQGYYSFAISSLADGGVVDRKPVVYVASNDGMLHAFDALTGEEVFAYLPGAVVTGGFDAGDATKIPAAGDPGHEQLLARIADVTYDGADHQFYNDGLMTVADAYDGSQWRTVLVGTTGRGPARTIYALDVTNPEAPEFLWERYAKDGLVDSQYIGQMTGKPLVAQVANGEWRVLVGNGYNSAADRAALLEFDLFTGDLTAHQMPVSGADTPLGLAAPAWIDTSAPPDGIHDVVYAGSLDDDGAGTLWRIDLGDWTIEEVFATKGGQPITAGMRAVVDPDGNHWVFFGTGLYLDSTDIADNTLQSWYGIRVYDADSSSEATGLTVGDGDLVQRSIEGDIQIGDLNNTGITTMARVFTRYDDATDPDVANHDGWYIDLQYPPGTETGERMVEPNQYSAGLLSGTSLVPDERDDCSPSGMSWQMTLDAFTGTNVEEPFIDVNGDGVVDDSDNLSVDGVGYAAGAVGFNIMANSPITVGNTMLISFEDGSIGAFQTSGAVSSGDGKRTSWRELVIE